MGTSNRWRVLIPLLVLWLAFGLRLFRLDFQSIWWDEGHSIFVAGHPVTDIPTLPAMDVHPPAYFALLHGWMAVVGRSEFGLRFLSVVFSMLTVALLSRMAASMGRRIGAEPVGPAAVGGLLAALSPLYVTYAQEVRSYSMITFLALASTYALWQIIFTGRRGTAVVIHVVTTAACLYTHYFTIFLLLFQNLAWLWWVWAGKGAGDRPGKREAARRFRLWAGTQAAILLLFGPQLLLALRQVTSYTNPNLTPPGLWDFVSRSWQAYTVGLSIDPAPARWGMGLLLIALLGSWLPGLARLGRGTGPRSQLIVQNLLFLLGWFLIPLAAYFVVLQAQPSFEPRYMILVTPALFLLLALGITAAPSPARRTETGGRRNLLRPALLAISALVFIFGLNSAFTNERYFKDDSAGVAEWLTAETTARDIVYIDVPHPFHYYAGRIPAPSRYLFVDIHTAADVLSREAAGRERLFWVTWRGSDTDPRGVIPFLAEKYGRLLGERDFRGYRVRWFSLPPAGTRFRLPEELAPAQATFGEVLRLEGLAYGGRPAGETSLRAGEPAWVTLHFRLLQETGVDYRVSVRLRGEDGSQVAQVDKDLLNDRHFRTSAWPVDDPALNQGTNVYSLPVPAETRPGNYRLEVVVYNGQPPYPSEGVTGHASADGVAAILGTLTVLP